MTRYKKAMVRAAFLGVLLASGACWDGDPWRSALYPETWEPGYADAQGRFLHDFSYAGYKNGEEPIPVVEGPVTKVTDAGADPTGQQDSTAAFQQAIAAGGVVLAPAGTYRIDGTLTVTNPGVVIRGEGPDKTFLYFTKAQGMSHQAHLTFKGNVQREADRPLKEDAANLSHHVVLENAAGIQPGDEIAIGWVITDAFRAEHGMQKYWGFSAGQWRAIFRREVKSVQGNKITFQVPLRYPVRKAHQGSVRKESGYLKNCGLEDLAVSNAIDWDQAWENDQVAVAEFVDVKDGWVKNVKSWKSPVANTKGRHLQSSGIRVRGSKRVTVKDCVLSLPQHRGGGGNGYLFEIRSSNEILTVDCEATEGRHNFIQNWDFGTTGCVWLRIRSADGRAEFVKGGLAIVGRSEYHHALATANLVDDSVLDDGWNAKNRKNESSGAGHTSTQCVFWNVRGKGAVHSDQFGDGYVIGTSGGLGVSGDDYREGVGRGEGLVPSSLYEDQLAKRLE